MHQQRIVIQCRLRRLRIETLTRRRLKSKLRLLLVALPQVKLPQLQLRVLRQRIRRPHRQLHHPYRIGILSRIDIRQPHKIRIPPQRLVGRTQVLLIIRKSPVRISQSVIRISQYPVHLTRMIALRIRLYKRLRQSHGLLQLPVEKDRLCRIKRRLLAKHRMILQSVKPLQRRRILPPTVRHIPQVIIRRVAIFLAVLVQQPKPPFRFSRHPRLQQRVCPSETIIFLLGRRQVIDLATVKPLLRRWPLLTVKIIRSNQKRPLVAVHTFGMLLHKCHQLLAAAFFTPIKTACRQHIFGILLQSRIGASGKKFGQHLVRCRIIPLQK